MQQFAVVTHSYGEVAVVKAQRASSCGSCAGKSACSTLGSWKERSMELHVINRMGAAVGDEVVVEVPDHFILKSAFHLYGLPMLIFFAAGTAAYLVSPVLGLTDRDLWAALTGIAAVILYYVAVGSTEGRGHGRERVHLNARIVRIQTHHDDSPLVCHNP
jgi:sigma-E factor negative regulatory protein RseC